MEGLDLKSALVVACSAISIGCASDDYTRLYHVEPLAPGWTWDDVRSMDNMGPVLVDDGLNVVVYSERAERIELMLFDDPESELPTWQAEMVQDPDGGPLWSLYVEGRSLRSQERPA